MSSISLEPLLESHPDLSDVAQGISSWLDEHPHRDFIDSFALFRDLGNAYTADEIVSFLSALEESNLVSVCYRVIDLRGCFVEGKYNSFSEIPVLAEGSTGEFFDVERDNIVQVYEFSR